VSAQPWPLADHIDHALIAALDAGTRELALPIDNSKRAAGTYVSGEIVRRHGARGLPDGSLTVRFTGSAGQSFGAFLAPGVTLQLAGDANDYAGKGMSGGRIVIAPPAARRFAPEENVIAATSCSTARPRATAMNGTPASFAVRNPGARRRRGRRRHGCEYYDRRRRDRARRGRPQLRRRHVGRHCVRVRCRAPVPRALHPTWSVLEPLCRRQRRVARAFADRGSCPLHRDACAEAARQLGARVAEVVKVMPIEYKRARARRVAHG
jgi:hypothetical protein